jgi:glycosyltransferase involved in cell wall biosynthesis
MNVVKKREGLSISAIVPVFDEKKTVGGVVKIILSNPLIDEVICVNDGSTDGSLHVLKSFGNKINLIDLKKNRGKGHALAAGVRRARGDIVVFLDADFVNLNEGYINELLTPILQGGYDGVVGYLTEDSDTLFSVLSGQRAYFRKDLIPLLSKMSKTRFGVEVYLNEQFKKKNIKRIPLLGLRVLFKYEKFDKKKAFKEYLKAAVEITKVVGEKEVVLSEDILGKIQNSKNIGELKNVVERIRNKKLRLVIRKYLLRYIEDARVRLEERVVSSR